MTPYVTSRPCPELRIVLPTGERGTITHERWCAGTLYGYSVELPGGRVQMVEPGRVVEACDMPVPPGGWRVQAELVGESASS